MAEANYRTNNNKFSIKFEYETIKELFEQVSEFEEVMGISECAACGSNDIRPSTRKVDDFTFYEMVCNNPDCGCRLQFGQHKKGGGLFPKRDSGKAGWAKPDFTPKQQAPQKQGSQPQQRR